MTSKAFSILLAGTMMGMFLLNGCQSPHFASQAAPPARFREGDRADIVLRFYRWDTIHLLRPDSRQAGFLPILTRDTLEGELKSRLVNKELAVVLFGRLIPGPLETQQAVEWVEFLSRLGFKRTVILRGGTNNDIDGLPVVRDSAVAAAHSEAFTSLALLSKQRSSIPSR